MDLCLAKIGRFPLRRDVAIFIDPPWALPEIEQFRFSVQIQEAVPFVSHVTLYTQRGGLRGAAVKAFMPSPDLGGQVTYEALHVCQRLRIWDEHPVDDTHVLEICCEARVVAGKHSAAEET